MKKLISSRDWGILMAIGCITKYFVAMMTGFCIYDALDKTVIAYFLAIFSVSVIMGIAEFIRKEMRSIYEVVSISKLPDGFDFFESGVPQKHATVIVRKKS